MYYNVSVLIQVNRKRIDLLHGLLSLPSRKELETQVRSKRLEDSKMDPLNGTTHMATKLVSSSSDKLPNRIAGHPGYPGKAPPPGSGSGANVCVACI